MINIKFKLLITQNLDTITYISACFSKTVKDIKLKFSVVKKGKFPFLSYMIYYVLDKNNRCKY